jgi:NAD(P)-dependent dehydrogenase (short-subunit alcohol dehydrogenase family)
MGMSDKWTAGDIPHQSGRTAVVTGANSGLGLITARELARKGAHVVLACRNTAKGEEVAAAILQETAGAEVDVRGLDLAELSSVHAFAEGQTSPVDLLVNNAGVMGIPRRQTKDGFEMQFGTNHLGHFALTGLLLPRLLDTAAPRVVTLSSTAHKFGRMNFNDLQGERRYFRWSAYGQSKLANLLFAFELQRRADAAGLPLKSVAAHPGYAATNLQTRGPEAGGILTRIEDGLMAVSNRVVAQSEEMGALPTLYAATVPDLQGGTYVGPDGFQEQRGHPVRVGSTAASKDRDAARRLWQASEELTGVTYELTPAPA